jgi:hypothetical protein
MSGITEDQAKAAIESIFIQLNDIYNSAYIFDSTRLNTIFIQQTVANAEQNMINEIDIMRNIVIRCLKLYYRLSENYKYLHYELNIKLCRCLFNYLFYIYQYYKMVEDFKEYKLYCQPLSTSSVQPLAKCLKPLNLIEYANTIIKPTTSYSNPITTLEQYKYFIIYRFNKDILRDKRSSTELTLLESHIYILSPPASFKLLIITHDANYIISDIKNYIRAFRRYIFNKIFKIPIDNKYIAFLQYQGICWFISMITAFSYSDMNRDLITTKLQVIPRNNYNDFIIFIEYIINNITARGLTYDSDTQENINQYMIYMRDNPILVLKYIVIKYGKENLCTNPDQFKNDIKIFIDKLIALHIYYINNNIIISNLKHNDIKDSFGYIIFYNLFKGAQLEFRSISPTLNSIDITNYIFTTYINGQLDNIDLNYFGLYDNQYYILKYLYFLLNITTVYTKIVSHPNRTKTFHKLLNDTIEVSPDVIILHTSKLSEDAIYDSTPIPGMRLNNLNDILTYNKQRYKLDYLLQASDPSVSCNACGHCISAITYHGRNYIHDSKNVVDIIKHNGEDIMKPCSLIFRDWKSDIFKDKCYSIENCGYNSIERARVARAVQNTASIRLCYDFNQNYTLVYVKIPDIAPRAAIVTRSAALRSSVVLSPSVQMSSHDPMQMQAAAGISTYDPMLPGGGSNKYISLQKKIEFIYKNRKYSRTIYKKNNKKYILFNKEYHLLSKIKNLKL